MPDTTLEARSLAQAIAFDMADDAAEVGDFVASQDLGDGVTDFRFAANIPGYEGWQWSVTMYHDEELDHWTVNESSLLPTEKALLPPKWIPWKDRLEPTDLSVTDSIGTDPDDPRLEEGLSEEQLEAVVDAVEAEDKAEREQESAGEANAESGDGAGEAHGEDADADAETPSGDTTDSDSASMPTNGGDHADAAAEDAGNAAEKTSALDMAEAIDEFELSRRHVLSPLGRAQTAKRWYDGPHGPKALSTKTAGGSVCESCGFFIPLKGDLNRMFGVCANKWSPDDGRVVSLDHGCGEHSEIDPPQPSRLWVQSKPAFDDLHIDIVAQRPRDEHGEVELLERRGEGHRLASDGEDADDAAEAAETEPPAADAADATDATVAETDAEDGPAAEDEDPGAERPEQQEQPVAAESTADAADSADEPAPEPSEIEPSEAGETVADESGEPAGSDEADSVEPETEPAPESMSASEEDDDSDVATDEDIEAQTVPDDEATDEDIAEHAADPDEPEVVATVDLTKPAEDGDDDGEDDADEEHAEGR